MQRALLGLSFLQVLMLGYLVYIEADFITLALGFVAGVTVGLGLVVVGGDYGKRDFGSSYTR